MSPWHLHTVLLHQIHLLISLLLGLHLNLKFQRSFSVVPTSHLTRILSPPGSLRMFYCSSVPISTITNIVNLSQLWSIPSDSQAFHHISLFEEIHIDDQLSNYRPISNLSLISKIIERIVKSLLTDHLSSNNLLNPHQSDYCKLTTG